MSEIKLKWPTGVPVFIRRAGAAVHRVLECRPTFCTVWSREFVA
ncbi:hypothetical protein SAMN05421849_0045 [Pontibaca methylaminivorans]|uniref:Uncharacterized protein n=1 Tax=Pontibaca methylaminivorans TaxID=515897 RepID=A0A1R3W7V4_9RHOB|nr:hypothetical protein SAMN05421849_0045 [Pontibaca methylaminivorans]